MSDLAMFQIEKLKQRWIGYRVILCDKSEWGMPTWVTELEKTTFLEIVSNDDISDGFKNELNIVCVRGTSEMCVDLLCLSSFVQAFKFQSNKCGCLFICASS